MDPAYTHFIHPAVKARLSFQVECSSHKLVWSPGGSPNWLHIKITEWAQNWDFYIVYLEQGVSVFNKFFRWFWHRWFAFGTREVGDTIWILNSVFFFFHKRITASQHCVDLCHTSTWISHRHTYVPSLLNPPPTSYPICFADPVCDASCLAVHTVYTVCTVHWTQGRQGMS